MMEIFLLLVCTSALFYLGSRATITMWLWTNYPRRFASLMDCAACSGFWYAVAVTFVAERAEAWAPPLPGIAGYAVAGALGLWGTPLFAWIHQEAMTRLGTAVE